MNRRIITLVSVCILAGCGQKSDLKPLPGRSLPVAPLGADVQPNPEDLLELDTQAAPERNVELRRRSESREDDPFDLPPE